MDKKQLEEKLKERENIKVALENQYMQVMGQIAILKELITLIDKEENEENKENK